MIFVLTMEVGKQPLSEKEIKELILQFNLDESVNDLKRYYSTPTTWDIIKQSRRETSHTQFLAWLFGNKDFNADMNAGVVKKLLVLLLKWANVQKSAEFDKSLAKSIYSQDLSILSYNVEAEHHFSLKQNPSTPNVPTYGDGDIDIFITCDALVNGKKKKINIAIENKIGAAETTKCFDKNGKLAKSNQNSTVTTLYQTDAYHQYVTDNNKGCINLFAYLKPTICSLESIREAECSCKAYIQLNYQELLDNVIQPISELKSISAEDRFRLKDYIKTLGKPVETEEDKSNKQIIIMAMAKTEKELLQKFFNNNEELIRAAINAQDDDCEELKEALAEANIGKAKRRYTINQDGEILNMYKVLEKFIEFRLRNQSVTVKSINDEISEYIGSKRINVSDSDNKVYQEDRHYGELDLGDGRKKIKYTKEWADGDSKMIFNKFRTKVNEIYKEAFHIDVVPVS